MWGRETAANVSADIQDEGFDLVIMNPPFTSDTKHRDAEDGVLNAAFAAFNAPDVDQAAMADRLKVLAKETAYHGHAGLGSVFASLAHKKLKPNGIVALVLLSTAINGSSWAKFRQQISSRYADIEVVTIAGIDTDLAFSSDTKVGECLVVGRKLAAGAEPINRGVFTSLLQRPASIVESLEIAKASASATSLRTLEEGPYGGVVFKCGDSFAFESLDAPITPDDRGWGAARNA